MSWKLLISLPLLCCDQILVAILTQSSHSAGLPLPHLQLEAVLSFVLQ